MKHLKIAGLAALAVTAMMASAGAGTAAAELYSGATTRGVGSEISATLKSGTSTLFKDGNGLSMDTCTGSEAVGKLATTGGASTIISMRGFSFTGCSHATSVLPEFVVTGGYFQYGELTVTHIPGTTNGTVSARGLEITIKSTVFGTSCILDTGIGTTIGTLTGTSSGNATLDINATVSMGFCGTATWTGTYVITKPVPLGVEAS